MTRDIFFIRHAKSSWDDPSLADIDRPLNGRGKKAGPKMAKYLKGKINEIEILITSPATRARATAQFFLEEFNLPKERLQIDNNIYFGDMEDYIDCVQALDDEVESVALFGHNPTMTELANYFADYQISNVPTAGIVHIRCTAKKWSDFGTKNSRMFGFYFPKQLSDSD